MNLKNFVVLHPACVLCRICIVTCRVVCVTELTVGWSDLLAPGLQVLLITLKYRAIADLHTSQFPVAHALGFFVFSSLLLATDLNTETSTSNHYQIFLLFCLQSLWDLGTKNSSGLTLPAYDWHITALNEFCPSFILGISLYSHDTDHTEDAGV
jgi:hypothetical protein